jgi:hypothetical protein
LQRSKIIPLLTIPLILAGFAMSAGPASAAPSNTGLKSTSVSGLESGPGYVIVNLADSVKKDGATFYPTGAISSSTVVVIPNADGSLPNGLTRSSLNALGVSRLQSELSPEPSEASITLPTPAANYAYAAASTGYSRNYQGPNLIGYNSTTTVYYGFYAASETSQRNVGQGLGYYYGYNGSQLGEWSQFYALGSATSDGGGHSVPWGEVEANTEFRAQCATTTVCGGYFYA